MKRNQVGSNPTCVVFGWYRLRKEQLSRENPGKDKPKKLLNTVALDYLGEPLYLEPEFEYHAKMHDAAVLRILDSQKIKGRIWNPIFVRRVINMETQEVFYVKEENVADLDALIEEHSGEIPEIK